MGLRHLISAAFRSQREAQPEQRQEMVDEVRAGRALRWFSCIRIATCLIQQPPPPVLESAGFSCTPHTAGAAVPHPLLIDLHYRSGGARRQLRWYFGVMPGILIHGWGGVGCLHDEVVCLLDGVGILLDVVRWGGQPALACFIGILTPRYGIPSLTLGLLHVFSDGVKVDVTSKFDQVGPHEPPCSP